MFHAQTLSNEAETVRDLAKLGYDHELRDANINLDNLRLRVACDNLDKNVSGFFHNLVLGPLELVVMPFAIMFNPPGYLPITLTLSLQFLELEKGLREAGGTLAVPITREEQVFIGTHYVMNVLCLLVISTILKKVGARPRPSNPQDATPKGASCRLLNLRGREGNHSMPSADTAQSALCVGFIAIHFPQLLLSYGGTLAQVALVASVAAGRVIYHCHYIGDCIVGAFVGIAVAHMLDAIGLALVSQTVVDFILPLLS
jgi:membrane-associated phospholipid phosphatase